jgi:putative ABC transport system substrate-binding protein
MKRRTFIVGLGSAAARPVVARAQQGERVRRVGMLILGSDSDPIARSWVVAFREGLRQVGWIDHDNMRIDLRFAMKASDIRISVEELVKYRPTLFWLTAVR